MSEPMKPEGERFVALVDLDGTIFSYDHWRGSGTFGSLIPEAKASLETIHAAGVEIIIYTSRHWTERNAIARELVKNKVPFNQIICGKPIGDVYIDDKAVNGTDWSACLVKLGCI